MLNQLTFTRFIAAIAIVLFHFGTSAFPFNYEFVQLLLSKANIGVSYFFILSGFVMVIAYSSRIKVLKPQEYYLNRFARIYPIYALALTIATFGTIIKHNFDFMAFFSNATVIQAWLPKYSLSINSPGWSLSVEFFFYLLFPVLLNSIYNKYSFVVITATIITIWIASQVVTNQLFFSSFYHGFPSASHNFIFYFPVLHLNEFLIGNLAGLIFLRNKDYKSNSFHLLLLTISIPACLYVIARSKIDIQFHNGLMAIVFAPFLVLLAANKGSATRFFSNKIFILLGEISFSIYILQEPVHSIMMLLFDKLQIRQPEIIFYSFLLVLVICSFTSYFLIELPGKRLIKGLYDKKLVPLRR
jgi:peptidoglycan/LPS O-acetylase OafA/YrhL